MQAKRQRDRARRSRDEIGKRNVAAHVSRKDVDGLSSLPELWRKYLLPCDQASALAPKLRTEQNMLLCGCELNEVRFRNLVDGEANKFFTERIALYKDGLKSAISRRQVTQLLHHFDNIYHDAYENIFQTHIQIGDSDALNAWALFAQERTQMLPRTCRQSTNDIVQCFVHARQVQAMFADVFQTIATRSGNKFTRAPMKSVFRALEKSAFRVEPGTRFGADNICDVIRGAIECDNLTQVLSVAEAIFQHPNFVVRRLKDRFTNPTSARWRDVMINGYFASDPNQHVVELQIHHSKLLLVRDNLGGHYVYARCRYNFCGHRCAEVSICNSGLNPNADSPDACADRFSRQQRQSNARTRMFVSVMCKCSWIDGKPHYAILD